MLQFASLPLDSLDEPKLLENCIASAENLENVFSGPQLKMEIISFLNILNKEEQNGPFHSLKYIVKHRLIDCYANLYVALRIILTMPVSVASAEGSFSKLKLIKTYLRSTMSQYRLNGLAVMSIENLIRRSLNYDQFFADAKARKKAPWLTFLKLPCCFLHLPVCKSCVL